MMHAEIDQVLKLAAQFATRTDSQWEIRPNGSIRCRVNHWTYCPITAAAVMVGLSDTEQPFLSSHPTHHKPLGLFGGVGFALAFAADQTEGLYSEALRAKIITALIGDGEQQ